ncbi:hypothetical protein AAD001_01510 [Colwelliaceae bacterium 6471]
MTDTSSRFIQLDNWIFEVKSVRAIRVDSYGKPYDAIANFSFNGNNAYIDGLMTRENEDFSREDYQVFYRMCQKLGIEQVQFDRFKDDKFRQDTVDIAPLKQQTPRLKLVR